MLRLRAEPAFFLISIVAWFLAFGVPHITKACILDRLNHNHLYTYLIQTFKHPNIQTSKHPSMSEGSSLISHSGTSITIDLFSESKETIQDFICSICLHLIRGVVETSCGHLFCAGCLYQWQTNCKSQFDCPQCKTQIHKKPGEESMSHKKRRFDDSIQSYRNALVSTYDIKATLFLDRKIGALRMCCKYPECTWKGSLGMDQLGLQNHLDHHCEFHPRPCPTCKGEATFTRAQQLMHDHECDFRLVTCPECMLNVPYILLRPHQLDECPRRVVTCSCLDLYSTQFENPETDSILIDPTTFKLDTSFMNPTVIKRTYRGYELENHQKECPMRPQACKFQICGCELTIPAAHMQKHYTDFLDTHLKLMLEFNFFIQTTPRDWQPNFTRFTTVRKTYYREARWEDIKVMDLIDYCDTEHDAIWSLTLVTGLWPENGSESDPTTVFCLYHIATEKLLLRTSRKKSRFELYSPFSKSNMYSVSEIIPFFTALVQSGLSGSNSFSTGRCLSNGKSPYLIPSMNLISHMREIQRALMNTNMETVISDSEEEEEQEAESDLGRESS